MQIRKAKPHDVEMLTQIAISAKRHWGYREEWMQTWREALTITLDMVQTHEMHLAEVKEGTVGFYALAWKEARVELAHLWVLPDAMGKGVGRALFNHATDRARESGYGEIEIESDPNAEGFYLRMGAMRVGINVQHVNGQRRDLSRLNYKISP